MHWQPIPYEVSQMLCFTQLVAHVAAKPLLETKSDFEHLEIPLHLVIPGSITHSGLPESPAADELIAVWPEWIADRQLCPASKLHLRQMPLFQQLSPRAESASPIVSSTRWAMPSGAPEAELICASRPHDHSPCCGQK